MPQAKSQLSLGRLRSSFLPALLVVALGVTGLVTFQAYQASREHRAVVERVLAAYVSFVADRVQEATQMGMYSCGEYWLYPAITNPDAAMQSIRTDDSCGASDGGRFDLNLHDRQVSAASLTDQRLLHWLLDTIPQNPEHARDPEWHIGFLITEIDGARELVSYAVSKRDGEDVRAVGFVAKGALPRILEFAESNVQLPKQMHATGNLPDYFEIDGGEIRAAQSSSPRLFTQIRPLAAGFGGVGMNVSLRESGLRLLVPSGLPRDRRWEYLGLFALAVGLVLSSLMLLRREEQLARTRANFVSGVSHELRTPLAQIRMFAEMLLLGRVRSESDRRRSLEIIDTEARRLSQLVENVLQVARSENGHLHVNPIAMSVAPIVRECVESFSVLAQARGIEFRTELEDNLIAPVDSAALRQIVLNLLDNAAKYGPDGQRVVIGAALYENTARIWVDDEGPGIPVRERQRVFDPFYRTRDTQPTTGSGIGLAVVRELVALHGGEAWIDDAPDAGTRVVVQFPGAYLSAEQSSGDFAVA
ncbi:MAG TPA: HAMP domain-containing sensor histidine kinase [Longimicrobiales bacterium]